MRGYIEKLSNRGELHVVECEVDPRFELAAVVGRSQQESDYPVLFKHVEGYPVTGHLQYIRKSRKAV